MALGNTLIGYGGTQTRAVVRVIQKGTVNTTWAALFNVTYNGTEYSLGDSFTVNVGDTITVNMKRKDTTTYNQVYVNGSVVVNQGNAVVSYDYTIQKSTDVTYQQVSSGWEVYLRAYITDSDVVAGFERKITEGKVLVNGVAYSIKQGKTLVNGVAYDIGGNIPIVVTITGTGVSYGTIRASCNIGGATYSSATTGIEIESGGIITFTVNAVSPTGGNLVTINGEAVIKGTTPNGTSYDWTVPSGIRSIAIALSTAGDGSFGMITVTTT